MANAFNRISRVMDSIAIFRGKRAAFWIVLKCVKRVVKSVHPRSGREGCPLCRVEIRILKVLRRSFLENDLIS
jgi:hypothetical protein